MDASSSSSSAVADPVNNSSGYDVFINHRGPDTKKTFASHLYSRLLLHGFRPFLDQQELLEGRNFPSQIIAAIRSARVHVAIFSPTYANSQWCLDELLLMLESGAPIIPIFYNVDPADLRWTDQNKSGVYAMALTKLQLKGMDGSQTRQEKPRHDSVTIQKWRKALSTVANTSGFDLKGKFNGDEGAMLERVVERVAKIIAKKTRLYVAKYPTGLDGKINDFETTVLRHQHTEKVQVVGIVGWGGVGKTTLAKEFFNRKRPEYNKSCFLSDVRENAKTSLLSLQTRLLKELTQLDHHINDIHQGTEMLRQFLSSSPVLLVLDDIDHEDQVDALLPDRDVLLSESLILITSRDKGALARSGVEDSSIYKLKGLTPQHSRELFCSYAFHQPYPVTALADLVDKFLEASDGLPLLLKVFGALLFGKNNRCYWEETLLQVRTDIQKTLKISYDSLSEEEQGIFLDIAFFFIGEKKNTAIRVWKGSGWKGWLGFQNLESKCLVEVDSDNYIHMHDHLRDLGRQIGEKELPRRLWCPTENIVDWMHRHSFVITEARGIRILPDRPSSEGETRSQVFSWNPRSSRELLGNSVMKLQLLQTEGHLFDHILRRVPSPNLIWLSWRNYPYHYLPSWITMNNLRVLKLEGRALETLWQEPQAPLQLQELEIIDAKHLSNIPNSIGQLKQLERIVIFSSSLSRLPEEIHLLKLLRTLVLKKSSLKSLPDSFGNLKSLQHINLSWCKKLERLPDSFGSLKNLQHMDLSYCTELKRLPDSFGNLTNLRHMDLSSCTELERLPDSFGNLTNLYHINLVECQKLERLPDSFGGLKNLHHMDLSYCTELVRLPDSFGSLTNLHHINLVECDKLEKLPDSFGGLMNLYHIDLSYCTELETLPDSFCSLTNLNHINLVECDKLKTLPDSFGSLTNLHHINLVECKKLERLPATFGNLTNVHHMDLSYCTELERLPDSFGSLMDLQHIDLSRCKKLEKLPDSFGNLKNLQHIDLSCCHELERLPDSFGSLRNLNHIKLSLCRKLERLPDSFGSLLNLRHINLFGCGELKRLPDSFGNLTNLQHIDLSYCTELERLPNSFGSLTNLHHINLVECEKLERLPDSFVSLRNLYHMDLSRCKKLEKLPDSFGNLTNLQHMDLSFSEKLERLPDSFGSLISLKYLRLSCCSNLTISSDTFGNIRTLEYIDLSGCKKMEYWTWQLAHQRSLKTLKLTGTNLKELPSAIGILSDLEVLWLGSPLLEALPASLGDLRNLKELALKDCGELKCLPALVGRLSQLTSLEVTGCPGIELPFKMVQGQSEMVGTLKSGSSIHKYMPLLQCLSLQDTEISEVSFGEGVCPNLQHLILNECSNLVEVGTLPDTLIKVDLKNCYNLRTVERLCGLPKLQDLNIQKCHELQNLSSIKTLVSLEQLNAIDCAKLQSINLAKLTKLKSLNVGGCVELEELEGVEDCISLRGIYSGRCTKLQWGETVLERLRQRCIFPEMD